MHIHLCMLVCSHTLIMLTCSRITGVRAHQVWLHVYPSCQSSRANIGYIYIGGGACVHRYIHTRIHTCIHTYIHTRIHTYIHANIHTYMHTYIHTYTNTYIRAHTQTYIDLHTYVHLHSNAVLLRAVTRALELFAEASKVRVWPVGHQ
jgi:hypothetical protein